MNIQRNKLNIVKARRRVRMRSALLLTLWAYLIALLTRMLLATQMISGLPYGVSWLIGTFASLVGFGGLGYLGLFVLDGDHSRIVPLGRLSRAQLLWLSLLGVLAIAPASLAGDLAAALGGQRAAAALSAPARPAWFVQTMVKSALIAPVCEELFFRGYLLHALRRFGAARALVVTSLCFALSHGMDSFAPLALFGALLGLMCLRTGSLLAPVIVHMSYNAALIVLDGLGLSALLTGWSLVSCALRLALCAAFAAALKRAFAARGVRGTLELWPQDGLKRREKALLAAAGALLLASALVTTVLLGG